MSDVSFPEALLPLAGAVLAAVTIVMLLRWPAGLPHATPNARSLHDVPVPRVGGIALWVGWAPALAFATPPSPALGVGVWGVPFLVLAGVSLADDVRAVSVGVRLAVHAGAGAWLAVALAATQASIDAPALALLIGAALATVWSLNLYNFMDGSDGLAMLMAIVGFGAYGTVVHGAGLPAMLIWSLVAAAVPVFIANRPSARIFIGDVGAVPLGYLAAALGLGGIYGELWPAWFPVLVFLPFIADATATLLRRVSRRERIFEAHKSHYYQRLHQLGAGHRGTLAVYAALMGGTATTAVICASRYPAWGARALAVWCVICLMLFAAIDYHWRRKMVATP